MKDNNDNRDVTDFGRSWQVKSGESIPVEIGTIAPNSPIGVGVVPSTTGPTSISHPDLSNEVILSLQAMVEWALSFNLWKYTPLEQSGAPGKATKVFTCRTDPNTTLNGPKLIRSDPGAISSQILGHMTSSDVEVDAAWASAHGIVGPFLESVNITMGFDDERVNKTGSGPNTDVEHGAVSTTISYGFNGGFFGTDGTAGINVNYSHTSTMDLTDYIIRNDSDEFKTNHTIKMQMWGDGSPYTGEIGEDIPPLTDKATSVMPLSLAGIWELDGEINEKIVFHPRIQATYVFLGDTRKSDFRPLPEGDWITLDAPRYDPAVIRLIVNFDQPVEVDFAHTDPVDLKPPPFPSSGGTNNGDEGKQKS